MDAPAGLAQLLAQVVGVVADAVVIRDQSLNSIRRPMRVRQVSLTPLWLDSLQAAAPLFYLLRPLTDSATAVA